jgi:KDO2-lipid IV(A) lauroyltransferase
VRAWLWLTGRLSLRTVQRLGRLVGDFAFFIGGSPRRITQANISVCFPKLGADDVRRLTRESLRQTGCYATELGLAWRSDGRWESLIADIVGADVIDAAAASGKPVMVLAPHFGNWEILNLYLGQRLSPLVLYEPPRIASLEPIVSAGRSRTGSRVAPIDAGGLRRLIAALRSGATVAFLPDQVPSTESGEYAAFFGRPALTMTLAYRLTERFRPSVVLAYARRLPGAMGFQLGFERLSSVEEARASDGSLAAMNAAIERVVALDPAQYLWEYKRFRRPKSLADRLY